MALPPLADPDALGVWLGVTIDDEPRAEALLAAASTLVRAVSGRTYVDDDGNIIDDIYTDAARVVGVMAAARMWNQAAEGVKRESIDGAAGSFETEYFEGGTTSGLYLTDDELKMIAGTPATLRSIRLEAPWETRSLDNAWWCDEDEDCGS